MNDDVYEVPHLTLDSGLNANQSFQPKIRLHNEGGLDGRGEIYNSRSRCIQ